MDADKTRSARKRATEETPRNTCQEEETKNKIQRTNMKDLAQ